jgi:hypothetical protein
MHQLLAATVLMLLLPPVASTQVPIPHADLAEPGPATVPVLATWAAAGQNAAISLRSTAPRRLSHSIYQIAGPMLMPVSDMLPLPALIPGDNKLEIPLPASSERGGLLIKITSAEDGKALVYLRVRLLPSDAWESLVRSADDGKVFIDPAFTVFRTWAAELGVRSPGRRPDQPIAYYFGKLACNPDATPNAKFIIYERESPDPLPVIEVISGKTATTILLPPGFLGSLPTSVPAQALLLTHLQLLNTCQDHP